MGELTKIEWCEHSWSPWRGCTKVSPGCAHCYAETLARRNPAVLGQWGKGQPRVLAKNWGDPGRWNRAAADDLRCLVCGATRFNNGVNADGYCSKCELDAHPHRPTVFPSLCDWLDDEVPVEWLAKFLQLIHDTPNLKWLLLTKRPELWRQRMDAAVDHFALTDQNDSAAWLEAWTDCEDMPERGVCPSNVWVGTSVEDQIRADERIPHLLRIPAVGRFLSVEPLLGPVDLQMMRSGGELGEGEPWMDCLRGRVFDSQGDGTNTESIHWVIIGGESGPGARSCNVAWIRSLVIQCLTAGVPGFVKQLGARPYRVEHQSDGDEAVDISLRHPKGGDPTEWPAEVRYVREFPEGLR